VILPEPPAGLDALERAAWRNLAASAVAHGIWQPAFVTGLRPIARIVADYCRESARATALDPAPRSVVAPAIRHMRGQVRDVLCDWHWIEPERCAPPLRSDGIDADAARLCGLPEAARG
jgi:hypothetical protein